jgi:hypothetical protein
MNAARVCVGGHDLDDDFRSVRLLTKAGMNMPEDTKLAVGDLCDLEYHEPEEVDLPHVEDVLVQGGKRLEHLARQALRDLLLESVTPWRGSPEVTFDGAVAGTPSGRVYVPGEGPLPSCSTGYWTPDADLHRRDSFGKVKFLYSGASVVDEFTWAGADSPPELIPAGALVRVSLARWFSPSSAPSGYYVQISGVY